MSLKDKVSPVDSMGPDFTAESKNPEVPMPFEGDYSHFC